MNMIIVRKRVDIVEFYPLFINIRFSGQISLSVQETLECVRIVSKRTIFLKWYGDPMPTHQLKNENKMNFRSNKLKTRNVLLVLKSTHTK
jgi:hypothetical protein